MAEKTTQAEAKLQQFLESAGRSLSEAQRSLGDADGGATMMLSTAEIEVKAAVSADARGVMSLQPVSVSHIGRGSIDAGVLSTVRLSFVATQPEAESSAHPAPKRNFNELITEIRRRDDVARLEKILGDLTFSASFVPARQLWVVTARDADEHVVRELIMSDEIKETRGG